MAGEESAEEAGVIVTRVLCVQSLEDQTGVHSTESKGVRQRCCHGGRSRFIGNIVQITGRIRIIQIDRGRENTVKQRQKAEDGFDPAGSSK